MSKRGPKPTPTKLKLLRGNPGKRPLPKNEPQPKRGLGDCPPHLTGKAAKAGEEFSAELEAVGVGTSLDACALELLCTSNQLYREAAEQVAKHGPCWIRAGNNGLPAVQYSPYAAVMERERKNIGRSLAEFGLTPSSRSQVSVETPKETITRRDRQA